MFQKAQHDSSLYAKTLAVMLLLIFLASSISYAEELMLGTFSLDQWLARFDSYFDSTLDRGTYTTDKRHVVIGDYRRREMYGYFDDYLSFQVVSAITNDRVLIEIFLFPDDIPGSKIQKAHEELYSTICCALLALTPNDTSEDWSNIGSAIDEQWDAFLSLEKDGVFGNSGPFKAGSFEYRISYDEAYWSIGVERPEDYAYQFTIYVEN